MADPLVRGPVARHPAPTAILSEPGGQTRDGRLERETARVSAHLGAQIREERVRRGLTLREVAVAAGIGRSTVHGIEAGAGATIETYVRLARALRLRPEFDLVDPRRREGRATRAQDQVHAAMGEAQAVRMRALGFEVGLDEPFQHFQFAGRGDVVAWSRESAALLHIENRTRFPDLQAAFGSFNAKRRYLGRDLAADRGVARWRSETHVMVALWSGEVLRELRSHRASFESVCPDPPSAFGAWLSGTPPADGRRSILIVMDPLAGRRSDRRRWVALGDVDRVRPRYRGYSDAAAALLAARGA